MPRPDGQPFLWEILGITREEFEAEPPRTKPWPIEEDCLGCDQHKDGPHRFGCTLHGARAGQLRVSVVKK